MTNCKSSTSGAFLTRVDLRRIGRSGLGVNCTATGELSFFVVESSFATPRDRLSASVHCIHQAMALHLRQLLFRHDRGVFSFHEFYTIGVLISGSVMCCKKIKKIVGKIFH